MVRTTRTMFKIIEYIKRRDGTIITEIATELGYAKSTVHRHLTTLTGLGYVVEESDEFHVGLRFLELGQDAKTRAREPSWPRIRSKRSPTRQVSAHNSSLKSMVKRYTFIGRSTNMLSVPIQELVAVFLFMLPLRARSSLRTWRKLTGSKSSNRPMLP